ncbi:MAG: tyrosine-type recombinase/integrase [Patescibacteria group bacterium]|nr:tyrosine-type recombinase/integrase [Patescibacteria group bacterium]
MLISQAFTSYAQDVIAFKGQSFKTEENHYTAARSLISFVNDIAIEDLSFHQIRDWKLYLDAKCSLATARNYVIKLRVVLSHFKSQGLAVLDPETIPVPKRADKVPSYLSKEEVAQCISATRRLKNKCVIACLYASGVRVSELCSLNQGDIHDGRFTVVGKGGRARLCFLDLRATTLLDAYLSQREDNNPALFLNDHGTRITPGCIQETFKSVRKQLGLNVHPHTLRHSFATNLLETNTNLYHVSQMLGHRQLNTTAAYLHVVDSNLQAVYEAHHTV